MTVWLGIFIFFLVCAIVLAIVDTTSTKSNNFYTGNIVIAFFIFAFLTFLFIIGFLASKASYKTQLKDMEIQRYEICTELSSVKDLNYIQIKINEANKFNENLLFLYKVSENVKFVTYADSRIKNIKPIPESMLNLNNYR